MRDVTFWTDLYGAPLGLVIISGVVWVFILAGTCRDEMENPILLLILFGLTYISARILKFCIGMYIAVSRSLDSIDWGFASASFAAVLMWIVSIAVSVALSLILSWIGFKIFSFFGRRIRNQRHGFRRAQINPHIAVLNGWQRPVDGNLFNQGQFDNIGGDFAGDGMHNNNVGGFNNQPGGDPIPNNPNPN